MNYILFDHNRKQLLPFTHTRAVADIRCGILTMRERWEMCLQSTTATLTDAYLQGIYQVPDTEGETIYINGGVAGDCSLVKAIRDLNEGEQLVKEGIVIALRPVAGLIDLNDLSAALDTLVSRNYNGEVWAIKHVWDIFSLNDRAIREDFALITTNRQSAALPDGVTVAGRENVFIEEGAQLFAGSVINATTGPVYIGKDAEIMEGCLVRGPFALCGHAVLKMGAKVYGATTIGPGCKAGGEISNRRMVQPGCRHQLL